jgi:hypothetical protein
MKDIVANLNRKREGFQYSSNIRSFTQAMKIYGDCCMCDLFFLNYGGMGFNTIKWDNKKGSYSCLGRTLACLKL